MKYKGNLIGGQLNTLGDILSDKALEHIAKKIVGTPVSYNFEIVNLIGRVNEARYNEETKMVEVVIETFNENLYIGIGLGISGRITRRGEYDDNRYYNINITIIEEFEPFEVSVITNPVHRDWHITGEVK